MSCNGRRLILNNETDLATYIYKVIAYYNTFLLDDEKIDIIDRTLLEDFHIQAIISFIKFQNPCKENNLGLPVDFLKLDEIREVDENKTINELIEYLKKYLV